MSEQPVNQNHDTNSFEADPNDCARKQIEAYLSAAGDYSRLLINSSLDMIIAVDLLLRIVEFNPAAEAGFGYTKDEVLGKSVEMLYAEPSDGWVVRVRTFDAGFDGIVRNRRKNGETFYSRITSKGIRSADGETIGVMGISRDISEQMRMQESLHQTIEALEKSNAAQKQARAAAEAANRTKSEILANISHEIRTPLTAIQGFSELLLELNHANDEALHATRIIRRSGEHLLEIINDILDVSKIEAGRLSLQLEHCSPSELIAGVVTLMGDSAHEKDLRLVVDTPAALPDYIKTDPVRFRQILINLVGNAIKFTDQGSVTIRVQMDDSRAPTNSMPPLAIQSKDSPIAPFMRIDVVDTGIGIPESNLSELFLPFSQADSSVTRRFGGTGLGLNISKRLCEMLGGDITVQSEPGIGTTFSVLLPVGPLNAVQSDRNQSSQPATVEWTPDSECLTARVLVVEDGKDNQRLLSHFLMAAGLTVEIVENGEAALATVQQAAQSGTPFNCVLMDMQMPVMDGFAATRELRKRSFSNPIIALTAFAMKKDRDRCIEAGCDDYISKPFNRAELISTIRRHLMASSGTVSSSDASTPVMVCTKGENS